MNPPEELRVAESSRRDSGEKTSSVAAVTRLSRGTEIERGHLT